MPKTQDARTVAEQMVQSCVHGPWEMKSRGACVRCITTALTTFAQAQVAEALDLYGARHREDCHLENPCEPPSYHHQFAKACPGCSCGLDARRRG